jgi:hypothetical protein
MRHGLSGRVPTLQLGELSQRNRVRLLRVYLDGLAAIETASPADEALRAYLLARLRELDAFDAPSERPAMATPRDRLRGTRSGGAA